MVRIPPKSERVGGVGGSFRYVIGPFPVEQYAVRWWYTGWIERRKGRGVERGIERERDFGYLRVCI